MDVCKYTCMECNSECKKPSFPTMPLQLHIPMSTCLFHPSIHPSTAQLRLSAEEAKDPQALAKRLRAHPSQRVLSRAVYAEEYEASLQQCMGNAPGMYLCLWMDGCMDVQIRKIGLTHLCMLSIHPPIYLSNQVHRKC